MKRNGRIVYSGKLHLANRGTDLVRGFLSLRLNDGETVRKPVIMDSGAAAEIPVEIPADPRRRSALLLAELRTIDGDLLLTRQIPAAVEYLPLEVKLTDPPYRETIFSDMRVDALRGIVSVNDGSVSGAVTVSLRDAKDREIAAVRCDRPGKFTLPIPPLAEGCYPLTVSCGGVSRTLTIRKLPRKEGEVRFDADHVMYVNGKKFLPYGWFGCRDFERASRAGFNVIIEYAITAFDTPELVALFDRLHALGMKALIYCYPDSRMYSRPVQRLPLTREEADAIRRRIRGIKDHPALLGWYLCDEPDLSPALPARLKEIHDICREEDPWHPTVILNNTGEGFRKYAESGDVVMPDIYPNFIRGGNSGVPLITVYDTLRACADSGDRILWCTPQGFDYGVYGRPGQRIPTPAELRNMHYQTLLGGATGFIWYIYEQNYPYPELFSALSSVLAEHRWFPFFFAPANRRAVKTGRDGVLAARYDFAGERHLVVVNTLYTPECVTLPLPAGEYAAAGEPGVKFTSDGRVTLPLAPLAVRILTTDRKAAAGFSVAENERRAMAQRELLRKPGNLAYGGDREVKIALSGFAPNALAAKQLNDGAYYDGANVTGKAPAITLTFPEPVTASRLRLYGIDMEGESGKVELLTDGKFTEVSRLFRDPEYPKATGPLSSFSDIPRIRYRKDRDALSAKWEKRSFRTLRVSGFRARKIVEVELYP